MKTDELQSITLIRNHDGTWFSCMNFNLPEDRLQAENFPTVKDAIECIIGAIRSMETNETPPAPEQAEPEEITEEENPTPFPTEEIPRPSHRKRGKPRRRS